MLIYSSYVSVHDQQTIIISIANNWLYFCLCHYFYCIPVFGRPLKTPNIFCTIPFGDGVVRKGVGHGTALRGSSGGDVGTGRDLS